MLQRLGLSAAGLALLLVAAGYASALHPALETLTNFRLHLLGMAGALAGLLLLARQRRSAGVALIATLAAAAGLGSVYDAPLQPGEGFSVTLLYANLNDRNNQLQALAAALAAAGADILITSETPRAAAEGLRAVYPHHIVHTTGAPVLRTAIWSRYPLRDGRLYLNNTVAPTGAAAVADFGGGAMLALIGAHFSRPFERLHMIQAAALGPISAGLPRPLAIVGDFNAAPWSRVVAETAKVTGTQVLGGYRVTWQGHYPTPLGPLPEPWGQQIDQVLLSPGIGVAAVDTPALPGSDHRGVLVRLRVPAR